MSAASGGDVRVSVIIPAFHDSKNLAVLMPQLARIEGIADLIVCDAADEPEALNLTQQFGTMYVRCLAVNRGAQMNAGIIFASANVLLFHPPDVDLRDQHVQALRRAMANTDVIGGAFHRLFGFMSLNPGKQSIFVRRDSLVRLGGFSKTPLVEDVDFLSRLRRAGKTILLDPAVRKLPQATTQREPWRMLLFTVLYKCGVAPARLQRWYYGDSLEQERTGP